MAVQLLYSLPQLFVTPFLPADHLVMLLFAACWTLSVTLSPNISSASVSFAVITVGALSGLSLLFTCYFKLLMMRQHRAEHQLKTHYEASIMADNMLNHSLKNKMADAAGELEMYLGEHSHSEETNKRLWQCIRSLQKGMRMCQQRNALLKLSSGEYQPRLSPISLQQFGTSLLAGREVRTAFASVWARFDVIACGLIFENALSNAFKHGHPTNPDVFFTIKQLDEPRVGPEHLRLEFCVTNRANPSRPKITRELVENILKGDQVAGDMPASSDRIGLSHCFMVARTCHFDLTLEQTDNDLIIFKVCLTAETMQGSRYCNQQLERDYQLPRGLRFHVVDDSAVARRLVTHHLLKHAAPAAVKLFGEIPEEVSQFVQDSINSADVVIVDQNLEYDTESFLGTDLIQQLAAKGFQGLMCVRSANSSEEDEQFYLGKGAHCMLGKDMLGSELIAVLAREYHLLSPGARGEMAGVSPLSSWVAEGEYMYL